MPGMEVRPTPDRLRESLFNILTPRIEGAVFLDTYGGTGSVGIEAISRGAAKAIFIEKSRAVAALLEENIASLGIQSRCQVLRGSVQLLLPRQKADIVYIDPPYTKGEREFEIAMEIAGEMAPPLVIAQHPPRFPLPDVYGKIRRYRQVNQGDNILSFYRPEEPEPEEPEVTPT